MIKVQYLLQLYYAGKLYMHFSPFEGEAIGLTQLSLALIFIVSGCLISVIKM